MQTDSIMEFRNEAIEIMRTLAKSDSSNTKSYIPNYRDNRSLLAYLFEQTSNPYSKSSIVLRLTTIDSLYSTNAGYSYFSIEEMAEKIITLGDEHAAATYFYNMVLNPDDSDEKGLFSENYGVRKNLSEGSMQPSLMSKYAYYQVRRWCDKFPLGFPIYDRLAKQMYPKMASALHVKKISFMQERGADEFTRTTENNLTISLYIKALDSIRKELFQDDALFEGHQQFDVLDMLLWTMGKFDSGNLSLLMSRKDYTRFICNIGLNAKEQSNDTFAEKLNDYNKRMYDNHSIFDEVKKTEKNTYKVELDKLIKKKILNTNAPFKGLDEQKKLEKILNFYTKNIKK